MFTVGEISKATAGIMMRGNPGVRVTGVSIDTRSLCPGDIFFAIIGTKYDSHHFLSDAVKAGAAAIVIQDGILVRLDRIEKSVPVVTVQDTTRALGDLAGYYRKRFVIPTMALTGSLGKTTTKEMLFAIMRRKYRILTNKGSFNNYWGIPLTLFRLNEEHQYMILELGMNHAGEIERLCEICRPDKGMILNVAEVHLEFFESIEEIASAKWELVRYLEDNYGLGVVLNADDEHIRSRIVTLRIPCLTFSIKEGADFTAQNIKTLEDGTTTFDLCHAGEKVSVHLNIVGRHLVSNALAAAACAFWQGMSLAECAEGLGSFAPITGRMEIMERNGVRIVHDAYNASPLAVEGALDALTAVPRQGKVVVCLGEMRELGEKSPELHHRVGRFLAGGDLDVLVTVGPQAKLIADGALAAGMKAECVYLCGDNDDAVATLKHILNEGDIVLVKGSRALQMENIVNAI